MTVLTRGMQLTSYDILGCECVRFGDQLSQQPTRFRSHCRKNTFPDQLIRNEEQNHIEKAACGLIAIVVPVNKVC